MPNVYVSVPNLPPRGYFYHPPGKNGKNGFNCKNTPWSRTQVFHSSRSFIMLTNITMRADHVEIWMFYCLKKLTCTKGANNVFDDYTTILRHVKRLLNVVKCFKL